MNKKTVIGILAHVDAGKTTLAEAILYQTGRLRKLGRVDHGNTLMDTHSLERERGITIFASQAVFSFENLDAVLLDTPGHVDFSAETERMLQVMDYAILVISGTDGVQAHTRTLWKLLSLYNVPVFIFVTKMDFARRNANDIMSELRRELSDSCVSFDKKDKDSLYESIAVCREDILEKYICDGIIDKSDISELIRSRHTFPCYFGSGLKLEGIDEFLCGLSEYILPSAYPETFGAKVFKISRDDQGNRITHMKITGGTLKVRDTISYAQKEEKVSQLRIYNGSKFTAVDEVSAGGICAAIGLSETGNGMGLGHEASSASPILEPVMKYRILLPDECDPKTMFPKLKEFEEEDPLLRISWNSHLGEIYVELMGEIQTEVLKSLILERFHVQVEIDSGRILYRETINGTVEGVGHYEPLRHYAEVHLLLEGLPRGSGIILSNTCNDNILDSKWQRLICTHLLEKQHLGVLTGSPITDIKITLAAGRAHLKHTEGGDFRMATYRAVRQGLMQAESVILEPYYSFRLTVPADQIGRAISDIRTRSGSFDPPENSGNMCLLRGRAPVSTLNDYAVEVASYTGGQGRIILEIDGYDICHNPKEVIEKIAYSPESDLENTPDSIFCAHGGGFSVKWNKVHDYMHLESCLKKSSDDFIPKINHRNLHIDEKELEAIMEREFGPIKRPTYRTVITPSSADYSIKEAIGKKYIIVDGYNVIFAWDDLKALAESNLETARSKLMEILCNYSAFTKHNVILVFDAYNVPGNSERRFDYQNIHVVYTKENETGDAYIEKFITQIGKSDKVSVVTSDGLIQLSAIRVGVMRISASEFEREVDAVHKEIALLLAEMKKIPHDKIGDIISDEELLNLLNKS